MCVYGTAFLLTYLLVLSLTLSLSLNQPHTHTHIRYKCIQIILTRGGRFIKGRDLLFSAAIMAVLLVRPVTPEEGAKADTDPAKRAESRSFILSNVNRVEMNSYNYSYIIYNYNTVS